MAELFLIVSYMICGTIIGGSIGAASGFPTLALPLAFVGGSVGIAVAYINLGLIKSAKLKRDALVKRPPVVEQTAIGTQFTFRARMSKYLRISESDLQESESYKSTMPFWSIVDVYRRRTTRTAEAIRRILWRMRDRFRKES